MANYQRCLSRPDSVNNEADVWSRVYDTLNELDDSHLELDVNLASSVLCDPDTPLFGENLVSCGFSESTSNSSNSPNSFAIPSPGYADVTPPARRSVAEESSTDSALSSDCSDIFAGSCINFEFDLHSPQSHSEFITQKPAFVHDHARILPKLSNPSSVEEQQAEKLLHQANFQYKSRRPGRPSRKRSAVEVQHDDHNLPTVSDALPVETNAESPPSLNPHDLKRMQRAARNREMAQQSRARKQAEIGNMRKDIDLLRSENEALRAENMALSEYNSTLLSRLRVYEPDSRLESMKVEPNRTSFKPVAFAAVALCLVMAVTGFSASISLPSDIQRSVVLDDYATNDLTTRRLLSISGSGNKQVVSDLRNGSYGGVNCSGNAPTRYVNNTESLRLAGELSNWIEGYEKKITSFELAAPKPPVERLVKVLQRRADTFYVVSFQNDYVLLPATVHNSTTRPRISIVMPAVPWDSSLSVPHRYVPMMQIECEVLNTSLLYLPESVVSAQRVSHGSAFLRRTLWERRSDLV